MNNLLRKAIAECIGTFVLVFFAVGTAIVTNVMIVNVVATALAFGLVIVAMAYTIGRISGCHINPAVTLGCFINKRMSAKECAVYMCAQIVGGILGGVILFAILKMGLGYGKTDFVLAGSNTVMQQSLKAKTIIASMIFEIILTCVFVYVVLASTDKKANSHMAGIIIGLTLTLVHLVGITVTGTSVNPARSIGTAISDVIFSGKIDALKHVWVFIIAPLIGGCFAALLYKCLHKVED